MRLSNVSRWLRGVAKAHEARKRLQRTGLTLCKKHCLWTPEEDAIVRALYPDQAAMQLKLLWRTACAINDRCKVLKLVPPAVRIWPRDEVDRLKSLWKTDMSMNEIVARFPGKTKKQLYSKASKLKIKRPERALRLYGWMALDEVRLRARKLGYTMADLNYWAGVTRYFIRPDRFVWKHVKVVLTALRGEISPMGRKVIWKDEN